MNEVDEYFAQFPAETQEILQAIRKVIHEEVPGLTEAISYGIATFGFPDGKRKGNFIHLAGFKGHVSLYPRTDAVDEQMGEEILPYASGRGTAKFKLKEEVPYELIRRFVRVRKGELETGRGF